MNPRFIAQLRPIFRTFAADHLSGRNNCICWVEFMRLGWNFINNEKLEYGKST